MDKVSEARKEMTMREDGSVGGWGGKKYSGLGTHNVIFFSCRSILLLGGNRVWLITTHRKMLRNTGNNDLNMRE